MSVFVTADNPRAQVHVRRQGDVYLLIPLTIDAVNWLRHQPEARQRIGVAVIAKRPGADFLIQGLVRDGLALC